MRYTVYLDLLFFMNVCMDIWILFLESKILHLRTRNFRLAAGAFLGSTWICFLVVYPLAAWLEQILSFFVITSAMQRIAFPIHSWKVFGKCMGIFYGLAFLFGGIFSAVASRTGGMPYSILLSGSLLLGFCGLQGILWLQNRKRETIRPVELLWKGIPLSVNGLVDTGNALYTPGSGRPVHVMDADAVLPWQSQKMEEILWIPYRSVGKEGSVLPAIVIDEMRIGEEVCLLSPVIAFSKYPVSSDGRYQILLHSQEAMQ